MKLLCTESDRDVCSEIMRKLSASAIEAEVRLREPKLFDPAERNSSGELHEVWLINDADSERAEAILYPPAEQP